jgi:hypothetical protein
VALREGSIATARSGFDRLAYREPRPSPAVIHALGWVNRHIILPRVLKIAAVDFPAEDVARLRSVVRPGAAAFLAPNHPEFVTDWLIDKELSRRVSPLMAHWASYEVVNIHPAVQWMCLRNNLISNARGGSGREYSVRWARAGRGVLLHPEGAPSWHGDRVGPLVPGIVDMAWDASRQGKEPVFIAPVVWKFQFGKDVSSALRGAITRIETALAIPSRPKDSLEQRFAGLQRAVLGRSLAQYGSPDAGRAEETPQREFFSVQSAHAERLLEGLESRHGGHAEGDRDPAAGDRARRVHRVRRAIHTFAMSDAAGARGERRILAEIERLGHFSRDHYSGPTLSQEQIAECLTQTRLALVTHGWREGLYGILPVAVAPRTVSIRVLDPIPIHLEGQGSGDDALARASLLRDLRDRLQGGLDRLNAEIESRVEVRRYANPFRALT